MFHRVSCALCCLVIAGCGSRVATTPISGVITLDGQMLTNASVTFTPEASGGEVLISNGRTNAEGRYVLKVTATDDNGAVLGKHQVTIALIQEVDEGDDSGVIAEGPTVPAHDLTFEVIAGGSDSANFDLKNE